MIQDLIFQDTESLEDFNREGGVVNLASLAGREQKIG